jgi:DNA repair protein RecN (Recombination protein N)
VLQSLYIRDYALIEELTVEFTRGLNIITGETGAGKSILLGGLKLILGERAQMDAVRSGASKAIVEGVFDVHDKTLIQDILAEEGFDISDHLILRREVRENQSRAFINDSPASLLQLRRVTAELVDLHGQHEHQSLLHADRHLGLVDIMGDYQDAIAAYRSTFDDVARLYRERNELALKESELRERSDLVLFQIEEIDRVNPQPGESDALDEERRILENAEVLFSGTHELFEALYESDGSILDAVATVRNELVDLGRIDPVFAQLAEQLESARITIDDAAHSIQDYNQNIDFNTARLSAIRERSGDLDRLMRRYGGSIESVLRHREAIGDEHALTVDFEGTIERLDVELREKRVLLSTLAWALSAARESVARDVERQVVAELTELGMPESRFAITISQIQDDSGWVSSIDTLPSPQPTGFKAGPTGVDRVAFLLSSNTGEEMRPLERVASGGEVSRIMLALKSVLARSGGVPVLVFDEIDAGISGGVAHKVSERFQRLTAEHQLLVITHLPQVAARADTHFKVEKRTVNGRTATFISRLSLEERQKEIATLLSGENVTESALQSARELIQA